MSIKRKTPNKVLAASANKVVELDKWKFEDFPGDPYWSGGSNPKSYLFEIEVSINQQSHGDPSTRTPYAFNGEDIYVGDWIADTTRGRSLKIIKIVDKLPNKATLIVEDIDRYNTFLYGYGFFPVPQQCVIFEINDEKLPILNPLPGDFTDVTFSQEVMGRFRNNNPLYRTRIFQENHNLEDNKAIWVDPSDGKFKHVSTPDELKVMVGTVDQTGPGQDIFYFIPTTKVVEGIEPALPGSAGDLIYVNALTGDLTTVETPETKVAYIQLTDATPDTTRSENDNVVPTETLGINSIPVTFTGSTMQSVVDDINLLTSQHNVTASLIGPLNSVTSNENYLKYYKVVSLGITCSVDINGVNVVFDDTTNGQMEFGIVAANAEDMANKINSSGIPNIEAVGVGSQSLTITNTIGGPIVLTNGNNDANGTPFAGTSVASCTGMELNTPAGGIYHIDFVNYTGSGIIFKNISGYPIVNLGLTSVRNGELPKGLVVEQLGSFDAGGSQIMVVDTLNDLPQNANNGDMAYVIDADDGNGNKVGEWALFIWIAPQWVKISDKDSSEVDARTLEIYIQHDSPVENIIGTLSDNRRVVQVVVEVITVFDGNPTLDIGDDQLFDSLMSNQIIDLSEMETFGSTPNFLYDRGTDVEIKATYNSGGATQGNAKIIITYV